MAIGRTAEEVEHEYLELMGPELGRVYHRLWNECVWLHWKWGDFVILFGTKSERIDLLNSTAPAFFKMVQDMMWEDILLHICRLADSPKSLRKDNLTIQRLPELVRDEIRLEVESLLSDAIGKSEFAKDWRNRRIAHHDLGLALGRSPQPLALASRKAVADVLEAIGAVLNAVELRYTGATVYYGTDLTNPGNATSLLHVLRDGLYAEDARRKRWRSGDALPEDSVALPEI